MDIFSGIIYAPVKTDEDENEQRRHMKITETWHAYLMTHLRNLHPAQLSEPPSSEIAMSTLNYLCGHHVRWSHGRYPDGTPHTVIYTNPSPDLTFSELERFIMSSIVKYPGRKETEYVYWTYFFTRPEFRIVLGNGYTLVIRPGVNRNMIFDTDSPSCFASFVMTAPDEVSDASRVDYFPESDISISAQEDEPTLSVRVYTRCITVPVQPFMRRVFVQDMSFTFDPIRVLERLFPVLMK